MSKLILAVLMLVATNVHAADKAGAEKCARYCKPGISTACGASCIPAGNMCHKSWTTSCNGERPASATASYKTPKHVNVRP